MGNLALFHCFMLRFGDKRCRSRATTSDTCTTGDFDSGYFESDARDGGIFDNFVSALRTRILSKREIISENSRDLLPCRSVVQMTTDVLAADTGPEGGIQCLSVARKKLFNYFHGPHPVSREPIAGVQNWNMHHHKAYGLSHSLYDFDPDTKTLSGEPNADAFAVVARENNAFLAVADGVNWGEKSFLAARSAVKGCIEYLGDHLHEASTTLEIVEIMLRSFQHAQSCIINCQATLTTLCAAVVCKLQGINCYGLCVVNVGDSLVYVYRKAMSCVEEVTVGSHKNETSRDVRNAGGCLGPSDGHNPDLTNLTFSFTFLDEGDIVFLTTDGISDNFDPVILKKSKEDIDKCVRSNKPDSSLLLRGMSVDVSDEVVERIKTEEVRQRSQSAPDGRHLDVPSSKVRQLYACTLMKQVIESESPSGEERSAKELCANLMSFATNNTIKKRMVLENGNIGPKERYRDSKSKPGKLDHATVAAYEVGHFRPEPLKLTFQDKRDQRPVVPETEKPNCIEKERSAEMMSLFGLIK